jgi:hypothetical protein
LTNSKGPVPIGSWSISSGLPALSSPSAYSFDWIEAKSIARSARNGACGSVNVNLTV